MNVKKKIRTELDTLVVTVAESYNDLITEDIPDKQFEKAAETVKEATDTAETNLVYVANEVVKETILMVEEQAEKKADRLTKMLPVDMASGPDTAVVPIPPPAPTALEGPTSPLPTDVSGTIITPNMDQLVEQAEQAIKQGGSVGGAGMVDMDSAVIVDHDLGLTVAEESRIAQGLPARVNRPTIHVTGKPLQMNPETPQAALEPSYAKEMQQIGELVSSYTAHSNEALSMLASNVLSIVQGALGENFINPPTEAPNAE